MIVEKSEVSVIDARLKNVTDADAPAVLSCWKEIAQYMGKGVRTVQRWEQEFGLPVLRPNGAEHKSAVLAHRSDLDAWLESRWSARKEPKKELTASPAVDKEAIQEMGMKIRQARILRAEHGSLVGEIKLALEALIQSCDRLSKHDPFTN